MAFSIPNETFYQILCFLKRDDIEGCQLVCDRWNIFIEYAIKILPKRLLDEILIDETGSINFFYKNDFMKKINEIHFLRRSMETSVAAKCTIKQFVRAMDFFDGIRILLGKCFNVKTLNIYEPPEVTMQTVSDFRRFCTDIVCVNEVSFIFLNYY